VVEGARLESETGEHHRATSKHRLLVIDSAICDATMLLDVRR